MLAILAEKREAVQKAILTILLGKASTYGDYGDCNYEDRVTGRLLDESEFAAAMAAVYAASDVVLDEHIEASMKVVDSAYNLVRRKANSSDFREYWQLAGHEDSMFRVVEVDAAWCTPGYTAPHAVVTVADRLTGCVLGACPRRGGCQGGRARTRGARQ